MNIGIIHGYVGGGGGTEKTLHGIIDALEESDHNVTLYTFSKPELLSKKIKIKSSLPISIPFFGLYQRAMEPKLIKKAKNDKTLLVDERPSILPDEMLIWGEGDPYVCINLVTNAHKEILKGGEMTKYDEEM